MKFTIPKTLSVLGTSYIVSVEDLSKMEIAGYCDYSLKRIVICKTLKNNYEGYMTTVLHELFHAVFQEAGINQTSIGSDVEEIIVEQMSRVLFSNISLFKVRK